MHIQREAIQARSICGWPFLFSRVAWTIAICIALASIITDPTMCCAQSSSNQTSATHEEDGNAGVRAAQNQLTPPITGSDHDDPIDEKPTPSHTTAAGLWGPVPTAKLSLANLAPFLLPYFNNGPVFGMPGTGAGYFRHRTQLSGDWGGLRTELARRGFFVDLYSTSAYQDVSSGGLKTGNAFIQNTQIAINVDTGRAGLWSGGLFHITLESRYGSSPQDSFTVGTATPQYTGLAMPGPFFTREFLPTEYFVVQALTTKFSMLLGKINVLYICDQTLFGDSYKYYFANLNFNKNPMALNFYNTTSWAAAGLWSPSNWVTIAAGVFDPNSTADNFASNAYDRVNVYGVSIFSYKFGDLPGQSWAQFNWTNKPKIDLVAPFGQLPSGTNTQAIGVLLGSPSPQAVPINYRSDSWLTIGNFSQYLFLKDHSVAVSEKLGSGQPIQGIGVFGRIGYAPEETNTVTRDVSLALFANGLSDHRPNDSFGVGIYHNGISRPLKDDLARLTGAAASLKNEQGLEVFYDVGITPAIRLIPSYQHIWNPLAAAAKNERRANVFLVRISVTL